MTTIFYMIGLYAIFGIVLKTINHRMLSRYRYNNSAIRISNMLITLNFLPVYILTFDYLPSDLDLYHRLISIAPKYISDAIMEFTIHIYGILIGPIAQIVSVIAISTQIIFWFVTKPNEKEKTIVREIIKVISTFGLYAIYRLLEAFFNSTPKQKIMLGVEKISNVKQAEEALARHFHEIGANGINIHPHIKIPRDFECKGMLLIAVPGQGKTQVIFPIVKEIRKRNDRCLIYDRKKDYSSAFGEEEDTVIISPFDERGCAWDIGKDIKTLIDAEALASALVPIGPDTKEKQWYEAAQELLIGVILRNIYENGESWGFAELNEDLGSLESIINSCKAYRPQALQTINEDSDGDKQTAGVMMNLRTAIRAIGPLSVAWKNSENRFSLNSWLRDDNSKIRTVILQGHTKYSDTDDFLAVQIINYIYGEVLSYSDSRERRIWVVNDEQGNQPYIPKHTNACFEGRSKGLCIISAIQGINQLRNKYGKLADDLYSAYSIVYAGGVREEGTAKYIAKSFGPKKIEDESITVSDYHLNKLDRTVSIKNNEAIEESEFLNIPVPTLEGGAIFWIKVQNAPACRIRFPIVEMKEKYKPFIASEWITMSFVETYNREMGIRPIDQESKNLVAYINSDEAVVDNEIREYYVSEQKEAEILDDILVDL